MDTIRLRKLGPKKKGIMGVETLIIFIAMILVAAIAAGVVLRTQSVLQQRALAVGNEARERLATGIEFVSIIGYSNKTNQSIGRFEFLVRLKPGSYDIQLLDTGLTMTTSRYAAQAIVQKPQIDLAWTERIDFLNGTPIETENNLEYNEYDSDPETIYLLFGTDSPDNLSALQINLSSGPTITYELGIDFTNTSQDVEIENEPIRIYNTTVYNTSDIVGFLTLTGNPNGSNSIQPDADDFDEFVIVSDYDNCQWGNLVPNYRYCYIPRIGNFDTLLEPGELLTIRYHVSDTRRLIPDEHVSFYIVPKGGAVDEYSFVTPYVFTKQLVTLWP